MSVGCTRDVRVRLDKHGLICQVLYFSDARRMTRCDVMHYSALALLLDDGDDGAEDEEDGEELGCCGEPKTQALW
jgi:hypothetical protein